MAYGIQKFQIQLSNPTFSYAPGDEIHGRVLIKLFKPKFVSALRLNIKGECVIDERKINSAFDSLFVIETYFDTNIRLAGCDDENTEIPKGENSYPFTFILPKDIPSTMEYSIAKITYTMSATMERPWKFSYNTAINFKIVAPSILKSEFMTAIDDQDSKTVYRYLPCFTDNDIIFRFQVPKRGFISGETATVTINLSNKSSSVNVKRITIFIVRNITFHNRTPLTNVRKESGILEKSQLSGPFDKEYESELSIVIPEFEIPDMEFCKYIDVAYQLHIKVSFTKGNVNLLKEYDIAIASDNSIFKIDNKPVDNQSTDLSKIAEIPAELSNNTKIDYYGAESEVNVKRETVLPSTETKPEAL